MQSKIRLELKNHTAILTLCNPPAHTFDFESLSILSEILTQLRSQKEIAALVITGEGPKFFSAGADLKLFSDGNLSSAQKMADAFGQAFEALSSFRGVTIAALNGYAMGGGLECALACDFRIAEEHAELALPEASVGLLPCAGGTQNLTLLVGEAWAKRMILLGERVTSKIAREIGLVDEITPSGASLEKALEFALKAQKQSPMSVQFCKALIQTHRKAPLHQGLSEERIHFLRLFETEDQKEGVQAFLEKRKPRWKNA